MVKPESVFTMEGDIFLMQWDSAYPWSSGQIIVTSHDFSPQMVV